MNFGDDLRCMCGDTSCPSCGTAQGTLVECPDGGHCHHDCEPGACFRVRNASPLSGVFPGDRWPADVVAQHCAADPFNADPRPDPLAGDPVPIPSAGMVSDLIRAAGGRVPLDIRSVNVVRKADALPATWPGEAPLVTDVRERIVQLARSFPCLQGPDVPGLEPWDAGAFSSWARAHFLGGSARSGVGHAAGFVLAVWWGCSQLVAPFDAVAAVRSWDVAHRDAFAAWAAAPWWA